VASRPRDVFVNCPFDPDFQPIFDGIVFAIIRSGFRARCALETNDGAENRFSKIQTIVEECRYGIHDLSRTEADGNPPLPRFNMPLELGLFLGAKRYGDRDPKRKRALILDVERYRYQRFVSDLAGQDIASHKGEPTRAIEIVAGWLREQSRATTIPGGRQIAAEYAQFRETALPAILSARRLDHRELTFGDYTGIVIGHLAEAE
jgi:hypothetical protein